ncbi:DUF5690 family protein [Brevundimonas sp. NPDC058933]|uniref:DUF5690 family protein n=1 Tax=Brevundimonas sp. NPDC058933 TaxID=3346673 RepID=UPI003BEEB751
MTIVLPALRPSRAVGPVLLGGVAAFCVYLSMYAFRKPFAAAAYVDVAGWTGVIDFKVALVIAQVVGYALSKLVGVKLISELTGARRGAAILGLIGASWLALVLFAVVPAPWKIFALFLNGLPLGLIWGLVFSYLEGRRTSEVLGAILCASFIVASGVVKSTAVWLMTAHAVTEWWMPAATGALFMPLLALSVVGLSRMPQPDAEDIAERVERRPMYAAQRRAFLKQYGFGVLMLVLAYVMLTAFRDFRDNFAAEIWIDLGYAGASSVFTASELPIAFITLAALGGLMLVRDNRRALMAVHAITGFGLALIGLSTLAFQHGYLAPLPWMIASGAGLYLAYTPFNAMLFDRLIAATRQVGTAGFLIYLADASGYLGSVALTLGRNLGSVSMPWLSFFMASAGWVSVIGCVLTIFSAIYFSRKLR